MADQLPLNGAFWFDGLDQLGPDASMLNLEFLDDVNTPVSSMPAPQQVAAGATGPPKRRGGRRPLTAEEKAARAEKEKEQNRIMQEKRNEMEEQHESVSADLERERAEYSTLKHVNNLLENLLEWRDGTLGVLQQQEEQTPQQPQQADQQQQQQQQVVEQRQPPQSQRQQQLLQLQLQLMQNASSDGMAHHSQSQQSQQQLPITSGPNLKLASDAMLGPRLPGHLEAAEHSISQACGLPPSARNVILRELLGSESEAALHRFSSSSQLGADGASPKSGDGSQQAAAEEAIPWPSSSGGGAVASASEGATTVAGRAAERSSSHGSSSGGGARGEAACRVPHEMTISSVTIHQGFSDIDLHAVVVAAEADQRVIDAVKDCTPEQYIRGWRSFSHFVRDVVTEYDLTHDPQVLSRIKPIMEARAVNLTLMLRHNPICVQQLFASSADHGLSEEEVPLKWDAVAAGMAMSPVQRERYNQLVEAYLQKVERLRVQKSHTVRLMRQASTDSMAAAGGLSGMMQHYLTLLDAAANLSSYPESEFTALLEFMGESGRILTPMQKARLVALSYPSFPDILQIVQAVRRQIAAAAGPPGSGEAGSLEAQQ
ncbi:hypothetical protein N2152v2_005537 [Parachlorella kessleri]